MAIQLTLAVVQMVFHWGGQHGKRCYLPWWHFGAIEPIGCTNILYLASQKSLPLTASGWLLMWGSCRKWFALAINKHQLYLQYDGQERGSDAKIRKTVRNYDVSESWASSDFGKQSFEPNSSEQDASCPASTWWSQLSVTVHKQTLNQLRCCLDVWFVLSVTQSCFSLN